MLNDNLVQSIITGNAVANVPTTIPITTESHIYLLQFASNNPDYYGVYIVSKVDAVHVMIASIKVATSITVVVADNGVVATSADYNMPYTLIDMTKFKS